MAGSVRNQAARRVLITGGAGFLGSHTAEALHRLGHDVLCLDNLSHGSLDNLTSLKNAPRFQFVRGDVRDPDVIDKASAGVDAILHFGLQNISRHDGRIEGLLTNVDGTRHVLESGRHNHCRVVFASTNEVYGKNTGGPVDEQRDLIQLDTASGLGSDAASRMLGEHLCFAYHEKYGVAVSILRYFGVYGPRCQRDTREDTMTALIARAIDGEALLIPGDGRQTLTLLHVDDAINATLEVLGSDSAEGEIFNVGSAEEITILDLAKLVWRLTAGDEPLRIKPVPDLALAVDREHRPCQLADMSKIRNLLDFTCRVPLEQGLERTIAWQREFRRRQAKGVEPPVLRTTGA